MLEFSDMVEKLQGELQAYRQITKTGDKKSEKKKVSTSNPTIAGAAPSTSRKPSLSLPSMMQEGELPPQPADQNADDKMAVDDPAMEAIVADVDEQDIQEDEEGIDDDISEDELDPQSEVELKDTVALEAEELLKDHRGLEEPSTAMMIHED